MKKIMSMLLGATVCLSMLGYAKERVRVVPPIDEHGFWVGEKAENEHVFDAPLAAALQEFFSNERAGTIVDFGCGMGNYAKTFLGSGFYCEAYDGNPETPKLTDGVGKVQDLSVPFDLGKKFDWVMCLEVGEHIPKEYEAQVIANLDQHVGQGIVLSWAVEGQPGYGHINCRNNDYIKKIFSDLGYVNDVEAEQKLRSAAKFWWFKKTIMVFRKM